MGDDKRSCFYASRFAGRPFPVTYLLLEHITTAVGEIEAGPGQEVAVMAAVKDSLVACGTVKRPTDENIVYVLTRMGNRQKELDSAEPAEEETTAKSFAGEYLQWVQGLTPEDTCMHLAEYDITKATYLYNEVDCDDVKALADARVKYDWQGIKVGFEAVLFGFGGGYGEDDGFDPPPATEDGEPENYVTISQEDRDRLHDKMRF